MAAPESDPHHVVDGLFTDTADGPRLLLSRCAACGTLAFPSSASCRNPDCAGNGTQEAFVGPEGRVWSYTIQHYAPPPPFVAADPFQPYAIALVEFPEGIRIAGMVVGDPDEVEIGSRARLVLEPVGSGAPGEALTWKFRVTSAQDAP